MASFTVICDKCGNKSTFKDDKIIYLDNSPIEIGGGGGYDGFFSVSLECKNPECDNFIVGDF